LFCIEEDKLIDLLRIFDDLYEIFMLKRFYQINDFRQSGDRALASAVLAANSFLKAVYFFEAGAGCEP
jgi:hypothetical protein